MAKASVETVELPDKIPILPFRNGVLLPGAFVKMRCCLPSSVRLVEQELSNQSKTKLIGVVPACFRPRSDRICVPLRNSAFKEEIDGQTGKRMHFHDESTSDNGADNTGKLLDDPIQLHTRGTAARVLFINKETDGFAGKSAYTVVLEGMCRFFIDNLDTKGPYYFAVVTQLDCSVSDFLPLSKSPEEHSLAEKFMAVAKKLVHSLEKEQRRVQSIRNLLDTAPIHRLADLLASAVETSFECRLKLLDAVSLTNRLETATEVLQRHLQFLHVLEDSVPTDASATNQKGQTSWKLPDAAEASRQAKDTEDEDDDDIAALERKLKSSGMPEAVWKLVQREVKRAKKMPAHSPSHASCRQYLELLADLPWRRQSDAGTDTELSMRQVQDRLEQEHFGMDKVKQRIVEYIAVRKLKGAQAQGPILCLVGPPGVGKTSLAQSIASSIGRKFVRIALGGVRDEADIRGHRRTYIGSMPGRVIEGIRRCGVSNPVMLLDELDKIGMDHVSGDPSSALLEVLDPEQNNAFCDHFLGVPFDLSGVFFLATANRVAPLPPPLLDRLEVIDIPGYTPQEKRQIAVRHIIPRVLQDNGIQNHKHLTIPPHVVELLVEGYTREAGVRSLSRHLSSLARSAAVQVAQSQPRGNLTRQLAVSAVSEGDSAEMEMDVHALGVQGSEVAQAMAGSAPLVADSAMVERVLGPPLYADSLADAADRVSLPGAALGLVWTMGGGELLAVEVSSVSGRGLLHLTGQLGDIAKESAQIALTWVRSSACSLPGDVTAAGDLLGSKRDVHIHLPNGAVPKDGPSAGVTLVSALVSFVTGEVCRGDTAMTGEVTLRGLVLPVGGIKEKILAAHRTGIRRVIIPHKNLKDVQEVPADVLAVMEILPCKTLEAVLHEAFHKCPIKPCSKL